MKNIINSELRRDIVNRIRNLEQKGDGVPGKLSAEELIHKTLSLVTIPHRGISDTRGTNGVYSKVLKRLVLSGVAVPESVMGDDSIGVKRDISGFEKKRRELITLLENFSATDSPVEYPSHPKLGRMTYREWGRLTYLFLDHNLKSVGV